ncbi:hypothetical protein B9Z65_6845 [Elsinoe australis]|uniref:Xylanolytic transcriptional activator regulatory domain-containing protein n=1 Tax=Elsinoe australis TaxID=40998 RepID=A0A2P7Z3W2_9PEZI|nr:hypothetical protein B9Z65_6845 [Elsinoe australis]
MTPITPASDISTSATGLYYNSTFGVDSHFLPMSAGFPAEDNSVLGGSRINETNGSVQAPRRSGSFLRRAWRRFGVAEAVPPTQQDSRDEASIFLYGDRRPPVIDNSHDLRLPDRKTTSALVARYFDFAAPTYRFLHRPILQSWVDQYHEQQDSHQSTLYPIRQAIVLMVFATSCLYSVDPNHVLGHGPFGEDPLQAGETYYQAAQEKMQHERGKPRLESVQARLATALYQLNTSRLNQAWHTLGTTFQLAVVLGIHRGKGLGSVGLDNILRECQKRCFWAVHTLDTYLSVMLGRPPYVNDTYVDQKYPDQIDDEDIHPDRIIQHSWPKDCIQAAPVMHAQLTRIVKDAIREQALSHHSRDQHMLDTARRLNSDVDRWREGLPLFLSGGVHPASLVSVFRRQLTVLQLACAHAVMIINRPLVLSQQTDPALIQPHVEKCLSAAKFVLDMVLDLVSENNLFPAFWNTQYVTFNALALVYVWIMQRKQGRLAMISSKYEEVGLFQLAQSVQVHLAKVTKTNAPSLRYSIILEELQQETSCVLARPEQPDTHTVVQASGIQEPGMNFGDLDLTNDGSGRWDNVDMEFPVDPELWLQLDTLLFSAVES